MPDALPPQDHPAASEPAPAPPGPVLPAPMPSVASQAAIIVAIAVVAALYFGREVLIPVTLAFLLTFILSPLVELLRQVRLGQITSVVLAVLLALGIIIGLGSAIGTQVASLSQDIPRYEQTIEKKITTLRDTTIKRLSHEVETLSRGFNRGQNGETPASPAPATPVAPQSPAAEQPQEPAQKPVPVIVTQPSSSAFQIGKQVITPLINPLATAGIILVVTIFALLQKEDLRDRTIRLLGSSDLQRTTVALDDAGRRLSRYFLTQLAINTAFGVIIAAGLYLIGVPQPVLWGILGALLRFIPYIGSWIAALLPIVLAAAAEPGWLMAVETAALYAVVEVTIGQLVEPLLYGHATGLSPLAVVIAAIFWTWVWGPIGLIISTPLTLCLVVLGRHVKQLEFFEVLLGDRPPLSPVASFYQRMLADDPEEVEEQAERYLADASLSEYYDEVALRALRLATNDVARRTLAPVQVDRLKTETIELVQELGKYPDTPGERPGSAEPRPEPEAGADATRAELTAPLAPEWQGEAPVLCIAGRGPLDDAAAAMLAQLLAKHGIGARVVPHAAVSRAHFGQLDLRGVAMVCLCYLEIGGNPAHLRYLLRRLRARLPAAPLLVGLWPAGDPILHDRDLRQAVGADYYVTSLREAVAVCIAAAHSPNSQPRPSLPGG